MSRAKVKIPDGYDATECRPAQPGELFLYGETVKTALVRTVGPHWILKPKPAQTQPNDVLDLMHSVANGRPLPKETFGCQDCEGYRVALGQAKNTIKELEDDLAAKDSRIFVAKQLHDADLRVIADSCDRILEQCKKNGLV